MYHDESKTCGTCRFWGKDLAVDIKVPANGSHGELITIHLAPCLRYAVEPDAGDGAIVLLGPESHCKCHADAWEAALGWLEEREAAEAIPQYDYGVRPGIDYPATLHA